MEQNLDLTQGKILSPLLRFALPVLLALFYVHAVGLPWGFGEYATLAVTALFLSVGSAGVPGIAVVSAAAAAANILTSLL